MRSEELCRFIPAQQGDAVLAQIIACERRDDGGGRYTHLRRADAVLGQQTFVDHPVAGEIHGGGVPRRGGAFRGCRPGLAEQLAQPGGGRITQS